MDPLVYYCHHRSLTQFVRLCTHGSLLVGDLLCKCHALVHSLDSVSGVISVP